VSGRELAEQSRAFYAKVLARHAQHGPEPMEGARVLDFGCGWGRLTRFFARDVGEGRLFGCDPSEAILDVCRQSRVPATLARTEPVPDRLPFTEPFDLAYAFSVFTHLSERAHEACLRALHAALRPEAILVVTIRPPEYLRTDPLLHPALVALGDEPRARLEEPRYLFAAHGAEPLNLQDEVDYGDSVVTLAYVRERWSPLFELLEVDALIGDAEQIMLTLKRR
jgi:SAM-dependent methyltransferase